MRSEKKPPPKGFSGNGRFKSQGRAGRPSLNGKAPTDAIKDLGVRLRGLRHHARALVAARVGLARAKLKRIVVLGGVGVVLLFAVLAAAVTATVLLLRGAAGGLALVVGGRPWLGEILTGVLTFGCIIAGALLVVAWVKKPPRANLKERVRRAKDRARAEVQVPREGSSHG